ncbi:MmcQ/YjbR family DNA-binding protein [Ornithinicoccus hortensis]|uniref:YjbR protein n=1 Tax=Ornithinicoccus hortensis TaxID=82346 RepID=A0A542YNE5_9MICO|nr:MmcQ/YjbR family DNA-binding protein [Ornithinicoccus hortensis]TQL49632.1 YjbR protein [Ornithinicoccus hortensis]
MADVEDIRSVALTLERAYEVFVRDRRKFRVGSLVFVAFSRDEEVIEFAFPKEERDGLIASDPDTFMLPAASDLRFNWVRARMDRLEPAEAREFVVEAWRMCVPQKVSRAWDAAHPDGV